MHGLAVVKILLLAAALAGGPHPDSLSSSELAVRGSEAHLTLRCQALSLFEVVEGLDGDGNGDLDAGELAAGERRVLDYVASHYRLATGTARDSSGGTALVPEGLTAVLANTELDQDALYRGGAVDVRIAYRAAGELRDLLIEMALFLEASPGHVDVTTLTWPDGESETFVLRAGRQRARSDPTGRGAFAAFLGLGWSHILSGWDHIAFLLALLLASRRLRSLVGVVTAFTVAHSVTLATAALGWVDVGSASGFIEALIALSIAYVAAENVFLPQQERTRWPEAFVFGLVHGLGFAGFLMEALLGERSKLVPLFAFNLGVELGQLAIITLAALLLAHLPGRARGDDEFLAPSWLRRWGSAAIALLGLYWFLRRI